MIGWGSGRSVGAPAYPEMFETSVMSLSVTSWLWWTRGSTSILMPTSWYWKDVIGDDVRPETFDGVEAS